jgi:hypothetical protein
MAGNFYERYSARAAYDFFGPQSELGAPSFSRRALLVAGRERSMARSITEAVLGTSEYRRATPP